MSDCTLLGFAVGMVAGALIVSNSAKAREMVDKGKKAVKEQVEKIAKTKLPDLNTTSLESAMSMVKGTARSMGVTVEE